MKLCSVFKVYGKTRFTITVWLGRGYGSACKQAFSEPGLLGGLQAFETEKGSFHSQPFLHHVWCRLQFVA